MNFRLHAGLQVVKSTSRIEPVQGQNREVEGRYVVLCKKYILISQLVSEISGTVCSASYGGSCGINFTSALWNFKNTL